jgi:UDP-N-acetylmuramate--alanine ligase
LNSLAATAVARELDMTFPLIREGLQSFAGVHRRLEVRGKEKGITVVDDYGHHPTEIRATLAAARQVWSERIIVVFQPHRFTRTQALFEEFVTAFTDADSLIVTDIYPASEDPIPGVTAQALCEAIRRGGHPDCTHVAGFDAIADHLARIARPSDCILTQGAGSIWKVGDAFLKRIREEKADGLR